MSAKQLDRIFIGEDEYVRADEAIDMVMALQSERASMLSALKEANAFIQAPAEDLKDGVLSRIRDAIGKATP